MDSPSTIVRSVLVGPPAGMRRGRRRDGFPEGLPEGGLLGGQPRGPDVVARAAERRGQSPERRRPSPPRGKGPSRTGAADALVRVVVVVRAAAVAVAPERARVVVAPFTVAFVVALVARRVRRQVDEPGVGTTRTGVVVLVLVLAGVGRERDIRQERRRNRRPRRSGAELRHREAGTELWKKVAVVLLDLAGPGARLVRKGESSGAADPRAWG